MASINIEIDWVDQPLGEGQKEQALKWGLEVDGVEETVRLVREVRIWTSSMNGGSALVKLVGDRLNEALRLAVEDSGGTLDPIELDDISQAVVKTILDGKGGQK